MRVHSSDFLHSRALTSNTIGVINLDLTDLLHRVLITKSLLLLSSDLALRQRWDPAASEIETDDNDAHDPERFRVIGMMESE